MNNSNLTASGLPFENLGPFPPAGLLETVQCRDKVSGQVVRINEKDYGGKRYPKKRFALLSGDELDELELEQTEQSAPPVRHSLFTEDELPTMRVAELKQLPEFSQISEKDRKKLRNKQDYITAIMNVRQNVPETPRTRATF